MTSMASQITSLTDVYSTVYSDADQRKHQSSASLAFVRGIHRDRSIPRTKDQLRGKCFHLMTSSWMAMIPTLLSLQIPEVVKTTTPVSQNWHHCNPGYSVGVKCYDCCSKDPIVPCHCWVWKDRAAFEVMMNGWQILSMCQIIALTLWVID